MRYLLDTNIVSAWARKSSSALMLKLAQTRPAALCVCTLVEHELLYGFALLPGTRAEAMTLRLLELLPSLPFGSAEARRAATMRVALARSGTPIGPYDTLIAATALEHGLTLVTHNTREFERVEGLAVEDWLA
jgi:tRNA(fMet)-specific endonuclease VapC